MVGVTATRLGFSWWFALAAFPGAEQNWDMEHFNADLELALLHIKQVEQRVADQHVRVERLRRMGAPTDLAEDLLKTLQHSLQLLKSHLARITGPVSPDKISEVAMHPYIAVLVPLQSGGWRAYIPDLVGCGREADDQLTALDAATRCAKEWLAQLPANQAVPLPRGIDQIRADQAWAEQRLVNWLNAIIKIVQL